MVEMIPTAELDILRADSLPAMPDTATILRLTATSTAGGHSQSYGSIGTTPCRLSASVLSGGNEQSVAEQLAGIMAYTLVVPAGTDIKPSDRIQVSGRTFEVQAGKTVASWNLSDSWTMTEIQR
jgi:hypothetical protein